MLFDVLTTVTGRQLNDLADDWLFAPAAAQPPQRSTNDDRARATHRSVCSRLGERSDRDRPDGARREPARVQHRLARRVVCVEPVVQRGRTAISGGSTARIVPPARRGRCPVPARLIPSAPADLRRRVRQGRPEAVHRRANSISSSLDSATRHRPQVPPRAVDVRRSAVDVAPRPPRRLTRPPEPPPMSKRRIRSVR